MLNHPTFFPDFVQKNRKHLTEAYTICTKFLQKQSIPYVPANAGFYVWVDLTAYLSGMPGETDLDKEREMNKRMLDEGVHLATSEAFFGEDHGWFRITFTVEKDILELALQRQVFRLTSVINSRMMDAINISREESVEEGVKKLSLN